MLDNLRPQSDQQQWRQLPQPPSSMQTSLSMIVSCGKRLANLVNDILDISALKVGTLSIFSHMVELQLCSHPYHFHIDLLEDVCLRPTRVAETVQEVVQLSSHLLKNKNVTLTNKINASDMPNMNVDEDRLQQVLQNIIGNAIKFTMKGSITVSYNQSIEWVNIIVSDTG